MAISPPIPRPTGPSNKGWKVVQVCLIVFACLAVYSPVFRGGWLWDDNTDITNNDLMDDPAGIRKIWFSPQSLDYYPIKASVQWIQWQLWGDNTLGYHLTNIALHVLSALLLWRVLSKLGVRHGWLGGLLFAVHPMAVESVAWIAELKNTLSLPPLLLAIAAYLDFERGGKRRDYLISVALFLFAMLCKSAMVMFPFALLLFAWWKRGRVSRTDFVRSIPFFAISLGLGLVTFYLQQHRSIGASVIPVGGIASRLACAGLVAGFSFFHSVFPFGLLPVYPHWALNPPSVAQFLPWVAAIAVFVGLWRKRASWGRPILFALGWFFLNLVPVLGLVPISYMRFTWVMDHLSYLSLLGIVGLAAAGGGLLYDRLAPASRPVAMIGGLVVVALLAGTSRLYAGVFQSSEALWGYTLSHNPAAWIAHFNLGIVYKDSGRKDEAMTEYREALRYRPDYPEALNNLGALLADKGDYQDALGYLNRAVDLEPSFTDAENNIGKALASLGRKAEAIPHFERAVNIDPDFADAHANLCEALVAVGKLPEAIAEGEKAVKADSDVAATHNSLGIALRASGRPLEAMEQFRKAIEIDPNEAETHNNLATSLAIAGELPEAISEYRIAVKLKPQWAQAHSNLGLALAKSGHVPDAIGEYEEAIRLAPALYEAHLNLGNALLALGRREEASRELELAAKIRKGFPGHQ